jgi:hypothetical protein
LGLIFGRTKKRERKNVKGPFGLEIPKSHTTVRTVYKKKSGQKRRNSPVFERFSNFMNTL